MKVKEVSISKTIKQTIASKNAFNLTDYNSNEYTFGLTLSEPTEEDIKLAKIRIEREAREGIFGTDEQEDPDWVKLKGNEPEYRKQFKKFVKKEYMDQGKLLK
jgi:hypothetical protein